MSRLAWLFVCVGLLNAVGCEQKLNDQEPGKITSEDVSRDAAKALTTAAEFSQQTKEEFQKSLELRLKDLDAEIVKLREKGQDLKDQAKASWEAKMADLETKRAAARAKLADVSNSNAEAWKDVQKGAQSAWEDLEKAFQEASREF